MAAAAAVATGVTELLTAKTTGIRTVRPDHNTTQGRFVLNQNTFSEDQKMAKVFNLI